MDPLSRVLLILLIGIAVYLLSIAVLGPVIIPQDSLPSHAMQMGDHMMNFTNKYSGFLNVIGLLIAVFVGFIVSLKVKLSQKKEEHLDELSIIQKALSNDEKKVIEEIKKAGEITQDSLRFRLNWSKAKISAIVNNLDRMNLVQRERQGKTYNILLSKRAL